MSNANEIQHGGNHYKALEIQTWDYIHRNGIGYLEGNAIKYLSRWREKGGLEDLKKAKHYIEKLIEEEAMRVREPVAKGGEVAAACEKAAAMAAKNLKPWTWPVVAGEQKVRDFNVAAQKQVEESLAKTGVNAQAIEPSDSWKSVDHLFDLADKLGLRPREERLELPYTFMVWSSAKFSNQRLLVRVRINGETNPIQIDANTVIVGDGAYYRITKRGGLRTSENHVLGHDSYEATTPTSFCELVMAGRNAIQLDAELFKTQENTASGAVTPTLDPKQPLSIEEFSLTKEGMSGLLERPSDICLVYRGFKFPSSVTSLLDWKSVDQTKSILSTLGITKWDSYLASDGQGAWLLQKSFVERQSLTNGAEPDFRDWVCIKFLDKDSVVIVSTVRLPSEFRMAICNQGGFQVRQKVEVSWFIPVNGMAISAPVHINDKPLSGHELKAIESLFFVAKTPKDLIDHLVSLPTTCNVPPT